MTLFTLLIGAPLTVGGVTFDIAALILGSALIIVGFQMACFYALARLFSVRFKLLPSSDRFERLSSRITVDKACQFGGIFLAAGIIAAVGSVMVWAQAGWGDLDPSIIARQAVFAVVMGSLGVQTVTAGFLWGLLSQRVGETADTQAKSGKLAQA